MSLDLFVMVMVGKWICFKRDLRCDKSNAEEIVLEMLAYLETADYSIREEMVLKVFCQPIIM